MHVVRVGDDDVSTTGRCEPTLAVAVDEDLANGCNSFSMVVSLGRAAPSDSGSVTGLPFSLMS